MLNHNDYVHAALATERQAALLAGAHRASLARQARRHGRDKRTPSTRTRLLAWTAIRRTHPALARTRQALEAPGGTRT